MQHPKQQQRTAYAELYLHQGQQTVMSQISADHSFLSITAKLYLFLSDVIRGHLLQKNSSACHLIQLGNAGVQSRDGQFWSSNDLGAGISATAKWQT